jgi:hypothetical protein
MHGFLFSLIVVACMAWPDIGRAQSALDGVMLAQTQGITAEEAARRAKEQYGGKVLSSRLVDPGDQPAYFRVKLISEGTVRVVRIENRR